MATTYYIHTITLLATIRKMETGKRTLPLLLTGPLVFLALVVLWYGCDYADQGTSSTTFVDTSSLSEPLRVLQSLDEDEETRIANLAEKLKPKSFDFSPENGKELVPQQFIHMHHMKTGGTSMDGLLKCAMERLKKDKEYSIPYYNLHECSETKYTRCKSGEDTRCLDSVKASAIMSYCAPLKDLPVFSWNEPVQQSITVLRHPVERVWSMFRFQTKACYSCTPLLDIYKAIDEGNTTGYRDMCLKQIQNHETANLLSTEWWPEDVADEEVITEAIDNMKNFFTIIGITEQLNATAQMAGEVFPFMKSEVSWSEKKCDLPHANASPKNNRCGPENTHWDLPPHPDEETRKAIEEHNQLDMKLYEAAVQHFELQKRALALGEDASK